uniref:Uncharacterized protein n=1 Tax=Octactis speculum TaxID=3111310 RepID=A0A7S2GWC6_9STRA|mmetsp:Transcript_58710/g.80081  ORF Transcript_58710/g.80081 Transcript_58710/m.80081 type:complete len:235 (+) Transcript_58710:335-1039(+)
MIFYYRDIPYKKYVGVLRNNDPVFEAFCQVDPCYYPFGLLAPLASLVFPTGTYVYQPNGTVYEEDAERIIHEMFDDITEEDHITRDKIRQTIGRMKCCAMKYFPYSGALGYLRHCVIMDAYFGINLGFDARLSMALRRCHTILDEAQATGSNDIRIMRSYIHKGMFVQKPGLPSQFHTVDVCFVVPFGPRDHRAWPWHFSNAANAGCFPPVSRVVQAFEFVDNTFTTIDELNVQ